MRCAGTWKVVAGVVLEITDASGHYRPTLDHIIGALEALKANGCDLAVLKVFIFPDKIMGQTAAAFLADAARTSLLERQRAYLIEENKVMLELEKLRKEGIIQRAKGVAQAKVDHDIRVGHFRLKMHTTRYDKPEPSKYKCFTCSEHQADWPALEEEAKRPVAA